MQTGEIKYFQLLKKEIALTLIKSYPGMNEAIETWKGQDIVNFQDDLLKKVNSTLSEKWFYSHIKTESDKIPRIDMLHILARYSGYIDWNDFKAKHPLSEESKIVLTRKRLRHNHYIYYSILIIIIGIFTLIIFGRAKEYSFCFIDNDLQQPVKNMKIEALIINDGESPSYMVADSDGCLHIRTKRDKISFVIKAPYYKIDTITRILSSKRRNEKVRLHANDYALMIHYFSTSDVSNWKKRRKQLDEMFADNARIYHVFGKNEMGIEMYNKQEFINKLTTPVNSLRDIEIIETIYTGNKISILRFKMN
ncbi:MAG: hypothetical protein JXB49_00115 [Bacteroidales bacterium]|nr:hypothetical protein [Bacteroidales bacterium]